MKAELKVKSGFKSSFTIRVVRLAGCSPGEFVCSSDGQCLDPRRRCDGRTDCLDASDELGCPRKYTASLVKPLINNSSFVQSLYANGQNVLTLHFTFQLL